MNMSEGFDPYHQWLGIPPSQQPPNHYRLLGVEQFESDVNVIANCADRAMLHLRNFQRGKYADLSQKLLNKVAGAQGVLLDPKRRSEYDAKLRSDEGLDEEDDEDMLVIDDSGAVFGEYMLDDHLASSNTGQIFKAMHRTMGREVALKILSSEAVKSEEHVARFRQKVNILGRFHHPNVVVAYDAGERDGTYFLIMEYVDGWDMQTIVKKHHPVPVDNVLQYFTHAANALGYAHEQLVYHRNVNPANLLIDRQGVVKVIGWGLCRFGGDQSLEEASAVAAFDMAKVRGAFDFMAPEQFADNGHADARSDIYSLGCSVYFALTGRRPFQASTAKEKAEAHRERAIPSLRAARKDAPQQLDDIFYRMLAKDPNARYQTMQEVIHEFQTVLHHTGAQAARLVAGAGQLSDTFVAPKIPDDIQATPASPQEPEPIVAEPVAEAAPAKARPPAAKPAAARPAAAKPAPAKPAPAKSVPTKPAPLHQPDAKPLAGPPAAAPLFGTAPATPAAGPPQNGDPALFDFLGKIQQDAEAPRKKKK